MNNRIRKVSASGTITTFAGNGTAGYAGDGTAATLAELNLPEGVAVDALGNVYIADRQNERIRKVNTSGIITTFAGTGVSGYNTDGIPATDAKLQEPYNVAIDNANNVYIADANNGRIRKVDASGTISTIAGNGGGLGGDGGPATAAGFGTPYGLAVDGLGNVYIADINNRNIRKVNTSGVINEFAGTGVTGFSGDGGQATAAHITPSNIGVDASGNVYIADGGGFAGGGNQRIRIVNSAGIISTIAGNGTAGYAGDGSAATAAELNAPNAVAVDAAGNIFIADLANNRIRKISGISTGINQTPLSSLKIALLPNPNAGVFSVSGSLNSVTDNHVWLEVSNVLGQVIYRREEDAINGIIKTTVPLGNVTNGMYFLNIRSELSAECIPFVVEK